MKIPCSKQALAIYEFLRPSWAIRDSDWKQDKTETKQTNEQKSNIKLNNNGNTFRKTLIWKPKL